VSLVDGPSGKASEKMTYCLGIVTKYGLVMASDSRTNAGYDQVNTVRKMHTFVLPGERVICILASGSLSCTQSVITLLRKDFDNGRGMATAETMYDVARAAGEQVRKVGDIDRPALEKDDYKFNVHLIVGGQIKGEPPQLYMIYPQGNPLMATDESPFLQIGEIKYGRPILDRGIRFEKTTLEEASKYALLSMDSTMKSNVTVGPPIDLFAYSVDELDVTRIRRFMNDDPDLAKIRNRWEQALRQAIAKLPELRFRARPSSAGRHEETIQLVDSGPAEGNSEGQSQAGSRTTEGKQS
jgi:putative proteasome-type protease